MAEKLFKIKLPFLGLRGEEELYFRTKGKAVFDKTLVVLEPNSVLGLNTYFNCFSYNKYKKYTTIDSVIIALELQGKGIITIKRALLVNEGVLPKNIKAKHRGVHSCIETTLFTLPFDLENKGLVEIPLELGNLEGEGYIYAEITAISSCAFFGGSYLTENKVINNIKLGIVICTYKREDYVLSNLRRLKGHLENNIELNKLIEVFLIDNGKTLKNEDLAVGTVYPNKNLGGSGGFTRGMVEVYKRKEEFSHFLLMDDDIVFDGEVFDRLIGILKYAKDVQSLSVGGTMLILDKPYIQHENGSTWGGMSIVPNNEGFDMRCTLALAVSERDAKVDYNAWWFMCMPLCVVEKYGLPLPMFIKGDDIEYGLRTKTDIMTLNGLGVWHEGFDKKYSGELEYYIKRNEMIINAIYRPDLGAAFHIKKLIRAVGKQLVYQRYYAVDLIFKAYEDFLKGTDYFLSIDGEKLHSEIRAKIPKQYTYDELINLGYKIGEDVYRGKKTKWSYLKQLFTLNGYLIPTLFYNKDEVKYGRVIDMFTAKPKDFFKSKTTIQYNIEAGKGFVSKQKRHYLFKTLLKIITVSSKMLFLYKRKSKEYQKRIDTLIDQN